MATLTSHGQWCMRQGAAELVADDAESVLASWNVRSPYLRLWFRRTGRAMDVNDDAVVDVSFDADCGVLTFDAWVGDRLVYGSDDFIGIN